MIDASTVASKIDYLDSVSQALEPRQKEMLFFLQWASISRKGLEHLAAELIRDYAHYFVSKAMLIVGEPKEGRYTMEQCKTLWEKEVCLDRASVSLAIQGERAHKSLCEAEGIKYCPRQNIQPISWWNVMKRGDQTEIEDCYQRFNYQHFHDRCLEEARTRLIIDLTNLCVEREALRPPWYCRRLFELLSIYMDRHAQKQRASIAETEVTKKVFRELEFSYSQNVPSRFLGESRSGKTAVASAWCSFRPGRARLVTVPETNRMRDFIIAHCEAFGIAHAPGASLQSLTEAVKHVHKISDFFICYDESQGLIPEKYGPNTRNPPRLDFVRFKVIDRGLRCSFFATPQSHRQTLEQYVRITGYAVQQWLGRVINEVILPEDYGIQDLLAVAKNHFPDMPELVLKRIIAEAMKSEGYLATVQFLAKRAQFIASEHGRNQPTFDDVQQAIDEVMHKTPTAPPDQDSDSSAADLPLPLRSGPATKIISAPTKARSTSLATPTETVASG